MSKAGIVTFHYGENYGGVLQALALQQAMSELGVPAEIVDYVPPTHVPLKWWRGWNLRGGPSRGAAQTRLIEARHGGSARSKFEEFRRANMTRSRQVRTSAECQTLLDEYDLLIAGSDQIWHFDRNETYFLSTSSKESFP